MRLADSSGNKNYREIIDKKLLPYKKNVWNSIQDFTLLEDNCGSDKATSIKNYLDGLGCNACFGERSHPV